MLDGMADAWKLSKIAIIVANIAIFLNFKGEVLAHLCYTALVWMALLSKGWIDPSWWIVIHYVARQGGRIQRSAKIWVIVRLSDSSTSFTRSCGFRRLSSKQCIVVGDEQTGMASHIRPAYTAHT